MILTLKRESYLTDGTLGVLEVNGKKFPTLENPRRDGDRHDCCLPPGIYRVLPRQRASGEKAFAIVNALLGVWELPTEVPPRFTDARSAVFLAAGMSVDDLVGCHVAPGKERVRSNGLWSLKGTRDAMNEIRTLIGAQLDIKLVIEENGHVT